MQITKRIRLDFARALSPIYVFAKQGDVDSRYVEVEPLENGKAYTIPAGITAAFACQKPDGHQVLIDGATSESGYPKIDFENNLIILELTDQTLAAAGDAIATAVLKDSITNKVLSTQNFILKIERSALVGGSVESSNEYQGYIAALNLIDEALKKSEDTVKEEEKRAKSELERQLNEETRQEAEKERVDTFSGWKEQIDGITADNAENRQNIAEMMPQITSNTQGITQNSQLISRNSARLTNVEQRISPSPFVTDSTVAYVKDVPANALPFAELQKLGGMTYRVNLGTDDAPNYVLRSAPVTSVESVGANLWSSSWKLGTINTDGKEIDSTDIVRSGFVKVNYGETYTIHRSNNSGYVGIRFYDKNENFIGTGSTENYELLRGYSLGNPITTNQYSCVIKIINTEVGYIRLFDTSADVATQYSMYSGNYTDKTMPAYAPYTKSTLPIPEAVQALDGYGEGVNESVYNYIDYEKKQFVKRVGKVDLGTLNFAYYSGENNTFFYVQIPSATSASLGICSKYDAATSSGIDKTYFWNGTQLRVCDSAYTDAASFKAAMAGVMLYYELATPEVTDISALITADNLIPVQGNGTITFVNEYGYAVPSTVEYMT